MSIKLSHLGTYNVRISYRINKNSVKSFCRSGIETIEDAEIIHAQVKKLIKNKDYNGLKDIKVSKKRIINKIKWHELLEKTIKLKWCTNKGESSINKAEFIIINHFNFNDYVDVSDQDIENIASIMKARNLKNGSILNYLASLKTMLHVAYDSNYIKSIPAFPKLQQEKGSIQYLTSAELKKLERWFKSKPLLARLLFIVYSETGCRPSELCQLKTADTIERTITFWKNKTDYERTIPISVKLKTLLIKYRKIRLKEKEAYLIIDKNYDYFYNFWKAACAELSIQKGGPYVFRHTVATKLAMADVPMYDIQRWLGHKRIETTLKYIHLGTKSLKPLVEIITNRNS